MNDLAKQVFEQATMLQKRYMDGFKAGQTSRDMEIREYKFALERIHDIAVPENNTGETLIKEIAGKALSKEVR